MEQETFILTNLTDYQNVNVDYSDGDLIIIDNVKNLVKPDSARLKMNLVALCSSGKLQVALNGQITRLSENQILLCPPGVIFTDFMFSHDLEFKAIFLTTRLLNSFLREKMDVWNQVLFVHKMHVITMVPDAVRFFSSFYETLRLTLDSPADSNPYRTEVIQALVRSGFLGLCGTLHTMMEEQPQLTPTPTPSPREGNTLFAPHSSLHTSLSPRVGSMPLFQRFLQMLSSEKLKYAPVEHYSSRLFITPKYLSAICKKHSGKTATQWITEYVLEDIRYYLRSTDYSIKQISDLLGFANPSFFAKYVKIHFGATPRQFRLQGGHA